MPSCREAFGPNGMASALPDETKRHPTYGLRKPVADVAVLDVERLLRRLAMRRIGHCQVDAAFDPVRLARLRGLLALAVTARGRTISSRRHPVPDRS